jgi:hypothetical protein
MTRVSIPIIKFGVIKSLATNTTGTIYNQLPDVPAQLVTIHNDTGQTIRISNSALAGNDDYLILPTATVRDFHVVDNANELWVKRTDESNTPVTVRFQIKKS